MTISMNNMSRLLGNLSSRLLLALICGGIMPFAFAPWGYLVAAVIALTGLILLIQGTHPVRIAYVFGLGWFGFGAWWLAPTFHTYGGLPWWLASLVVLLVGAILACFPALWIWGCRKLADASQQTYALLILLPSGIIFEEWLRGHLFTGLPWTALGNLLLGTPAVGWLSILGVYGGAALPVLLAASLAALLTASQRKLGSIGFFFIALITLASPSITIPETSPINVALVQPNTPQDHKWDSDFLNGIMHDLTALSQSSAAQVDLMVWPEAAVPLYLKESPTWDQWLTAQMREWHTPVLFGGLQYFPRTQTSQTGLYLFDEHRAERNFVGKHHLVPFGEYVPEWLPWLHKIVPDIGDFRPADDSGVLSHPLGIFGSLICYESIFPEEARARALAGADVLILVTNDAWYGTSPAAWQHFQAAQARAVETGRYVLRSANTGITAIIAPNGHITQRLPWWQKGVLMGTYQPITRQTFYSLWGDFTALLIGAVGVLGLGITIIMNRHKRSHHRLSTEIKR